MDILGSRYLFGELGTGVGDAQPFAIREHEFLEDPLTAFPKQFHVGRIAHVALITADIHQAQVEVLQVLLPVAGQYLLTQNVRWNFVMRI